MRTLPLIVLVSIVFTLNQNLIAGEALDTAKIDQVTGFKGVLNASKDVFKISVPRERLSISVDGETMAPFMGLTSWAAIQAGKAPNTMVMGDFVLFQDEVNPVMSALLENGVSVTALHNHFFYDEPRVFFMHIGGDGEVEKLAAGVRKAFDKIKEIRTASPDPTAKGFGSKKPLQTPSAITAKNIDDVLGVKGQSKDGMYKAVIGRSVKMPCGCEVGADMGVNTWAAMAGADDHAIVDGDFVVHENELQPVLKSLRESGINIVAIHHHMIEETPKMIFLHYWGRGEAASLAKAVKAALDLTKK